ASANRDAAVGAHAANDALVAGAPVEANPEVLAARAARDQAQVDLDRTVIRSPVDGVVTRRQVQVGQRVQAGATLMAVTPGQLAAHPLRVGLSMTADVNVGA